MHAREACYDTAYEPLIIANLDFSMDVDGLVIPSRHLPVELVFARIPIWRDVGVCSTKDDQSFGSIFRLLPKGISARDVRKQMPALASIGVQFKGKMIGIKAVWPIEHKYPKRVLSDNSVKLFDSRFFKIAR